MKELLYHILDVLVYRHNNTQIEIHINDKVIVYDINTSVSDTLKELFKNKEEYLRELASIEHISSIYARKRTIDEKKEQINGRYIHDTNVKNYIIQKYEYDGIDDKKKWKEYEKIKKKEEISRNMEKYKKYENVRNYISEISKIADTEDELRKELDKTIKHSFKN